MQDILSSPYGPVLDNEVEKAKQVSLRWNHLDKFLSLLMPYLIYTLIDSIALTALYKHYMNICTNCLGEAGIITAEAE